MAGEEGSLSAAFDKYLALYLEIDASSLPTNSPQLQTKIQDAIAGLIRSTVLASESGIFSTNETLDDLPTSSIKLLLLPALIGTLTLKRTDIERKEALRLAAVYLRDYLQRCFEYGVAECQPPRCIEKEEEEDEEEEEEVRKGRCNGGGGGVKKSSQPTPEELQAMARQRQHKIQRYRERKELEARLAQLRSVVDKEGVEEEVVRDYQLSLVKKFVCESVEELDSVIMERQMLQKMSSLQLKDCKDTTTPAAPPTPLKPILITRDAVRKNVFGLGYPSHPSLTVEEFYDQRVREGWFPDPKKSQGCLQDRTTFTGEEEEEAKQKEEEEEERKEEEDDSASLERRRERDEWRDTHRRGWGNTYNRS